MDTLFDNTEIAFRSRSQRSLQKAYWLFRLMGWNKLTKIGTYFIKTALKAPLGLKKIIKDTLYQQFCGGETLEECQRTLEELHGYGIYSIPDYIAEGQKEYQAYDLAESQLRETIFMAKKGQKIAFVVFKMTALGSADLLAKKQRNGLFSVQEQVEWEILEDRVHRVIGASCKAGIPIMVDAEESWIQDVIDELVFKEMALHNKTSAMVFTTCQMYRSDMLDRLKYLVGLSRKEGFIPGVKLVRGAYLEQENERALRLEYESPLYQRKEDTDAAYVDAINYCLSQEIPVCIGTHNEASVLHTMDIMKFKGIENASQLVWFAQLYGMSDHISYNLAMKGYRVAKYLPFGPMELSLPYLFRRANENKSVAGQVGREVELIKKELVRRR